MSINLLTYVDRFYANNDRNFKIRRGTDEDGSREITEFREALKPQPEDAE